MKRWPMPRNAQFSHYCCHCAYWAFERDIGCAHVGVCRAVEDEPEERDAYDKPCGLWKEQEAQDSMSEWISVNDRLPEKRGRYLVSRIWFGDKGPYVQIARWTDNLFMVNNYDFADKMRPGWYDGDGEGDWEVNGVMHWMPLPEPPKEG